MLALLAALLDRERVTKARLYVARRTAKSHVASRFYAYFILKKKKKKKNEIAKLVCNLTNKRAASIGAMKRFISENNYPARKSEKEGTKDRPDDENRRRINFVRASRGRDSTVETSGPR